LFSSISSSIVWALVKDNNNISTIFFVIFIEN